VKLSVHERFMALQVLPDKGNFITLKIIRKMRENLSFNEDEIKEYEFVESEGMTSWSPDAPEKDIDLGEVGSDILRKELIKMDEENRLEDVHFSLYEKVVEDR
jgi:hypothetical protein